MSDIQTKEYELLHNDQIEWRKRQFGLFNLSLIIITTIGALGDKLAITAKLEWHIVTSALLVFLLFIVVLSTYCIQEQLKIKACLQVVHEVESSSFNWETLSNNYYNLFSYPQFYEKVWAILYIFLTLLAISIPLIVIGYTYYFMGILAVLFGACVYCFSIYNLVISSKYQKYLENWKKVIAHPD